MKKFSLSYRTYLLRILTILCLLSSYLWVAPSQVHALSADSQDDVLGREQTYAMAADLTNNQMIHYDHWKNGYKAGLFNPAQSITEIYGDSTSNEQIRPQTFALSLEDYLWSTEPLPTDNLSLSAPRGDLPQAPGESNPSAPFQQGETPALTVEIVSSPYATVDSNGQPGADDGGIPEVFVVEAVITNTGTITDVVVHLDFNPGNGWMLLPGEDPDRIAYDLAPDTPYHAYWFARYPQLLSPDIGATHQYTVTAAPVDNPADSVAVSATVETRETQSTSNQAITYASAEVVVGVAFTVTIGFDLGNDPDDAVFSPVGNPDFDPSAHRLIASEVRFYDDHPGTWEETVADRLYFPTLHSSAENAEVTYTFLALTPENSQLCPYAGVRFGSNPKYDRYFCSDSWGTSISIEGTVSVSLTKEVSDSEIQQGQLLTYTISYINDGDYNIGYAWIWDDVPSDRVSIVADSISPTPILATDSRIAWQLDTIPTGSTGTFTFTVLVDGNSVDLPDDDGVVNHALLGIIPGSFPEEPKAALTSTVTTTVQAPMIALSKTDGQDTAEPGDALVYTLRITNSGSVATSGLVITDELPAGVSYTPGTATPPETSLPGQTLAWNNQNVSAGGVLIITIPVTVNSDVLDGTTLTNRATVTYMNASGQHTFTTETATGATVVQVPVLAFTKTAEDIDGGDLIVGDEILYTLQVTNTGSIAATGVTITDDLPDQVTCQAVSGDSPPAGGCADPLEWSISSLAPDATASLYITVTINPGSEGQTITNTGSVTGENVPDPPDDPDPVCADGSPPDNQGECPTTPEPLDTELDFTKIAEDMDGGYLVVGDEVLYTLQVTNIGGYTAYDVTATDDLPDQVTCQAVSGDSPPAGGCADPLVWSIPSLAPDATASLYITVTINPGSEGQTITNTGSVTSTNVPNPPDDPDPVCPDGRQPDPVTGECEATPVPTTTLAIAKTAEDVDGPPLAVGDEILYTLQVTNTGGYAAYNVTVTDDLPDQVTCTDVSGDSAPAGCADPLEWSISSLAPDATASLYITVTINPGSEGQTITNTVSVTGENIPDPPDDPDPVCPDGSPPDNQGECPTAEPSPSGEGVFLPIILMNFAGSP